MEDPEVDVMNSIEKEVDNYLDSRYRNCDHIASFTPENIAIWMAEDREENSSYNHIRARMIQESGGSTSGSAAASGDSGSTANFIQGKLADLDLKLQVQLRF